MPVSDPHALLERLISEPTENEWLEFKVGNVKPEEIGETVSALANGAMLRDRERAFIVFGVEDKTHRKVGTPIRLSKLKKGSESFSNWITRLIEPRLMMEFLDFELDDLQFSILTIEPTYERPVKFSGTAYLRVGENTKRLAHLPSHERALWLATGRRKFEDAIALTNQDDAQVLEKLNVDIIYELRGDPKPANDSELIRQLLSRGFLIDNMEGRYDITNLGAIILAKDITRFPSVKGKSIRIINYAGTDKRKSEFEQDGIKGYAVGFAGMMGFIMRRLPAEETYTSGVRRMVPLCPETAVREVIANALIHQDFTMAGIGPVIEIYSDRIEVINPGNSLIEVDRMIDERQSRNEKLASTMRMFGLCEERGGGLDKALIEIEHRGLPAPEFHSSKNAMRVTLFGHKSFREMSKQERLRACFYHCVLRWLTHDYMNNSSLRQRFALPNEDYQAVSAVISEALKMGRIAPADPNQGNKYARYIPYWAA